MQYARRQRLLLLGANPRSVIIIEHLQMTSELLKDDWTDISLTWAGSWRLGIAHEDLVDKVDFSASRRRLQAELSACRSDSS
jgi:hypothetical protein